MRIDPKNCGCGKTYASSEELFHGSRRFRICKKGHLWVNCTCGSTLIFPDAITKPWFSESLDSASADAREFYALLQHPERFPCPPGHSIEKIMRLTEVTEIPTFLQIVADDPRFIARIIGSANIATRMREGREIKDLKHAVTYLGLKACKDLITAFELQSAVPRTPVSDQHWMKAHVHGLLALSISTKLQWPDERAGIMYVAGLFANIGKLVAFTVNPEQSLQISQLMADIQKPLSYIAAEQTLGATPHQVLSEITLSFWGLDHDTIEAAGMHHREPLRAQENIKTWEVVALANQLSHWAMLQPHMIDSGYLRRLLDRFQWSESKAEQIVMICRQETSERYNVA